MESFSESRLLWRRDANPLCRTIKEGFLVQPFKELSFRLFIANDSLRVSAEHNKKAHEVLIDMLRCQTCRF